MDKVRFDPEDAILDLEALVKVAKINSHARSREFECVLDEVQKRSKTLSTRALKDLLTTLVGDPVKSKVLEKTTPLLRKHNPHRPIRSPGATHKPTHVSSPTRILT